MSTITVDEMVKKIVDLCSEMHGYDERTAMFEVQLSKYLYGLLTPDE